MKLPVFINLLFVALCFEGTAVARELDFRAASELFAKNNADAINAYLEKEKAPFDVDSAKTLPNPQLSYNNTFLDVAHTSHLNDIAQQNYRLDWLIELGAKRSNRIASAASGLKIAQHTYEDTMRTLFLSFAAQYYQTIKDEESLRAAQENKTRFAKILQIADIKVKLGFMSKNDRDKLELLDIGFDGDILKNSSAYKSDVQSMLFLLGLSPDTQLILTDEHTQTPQPLHENELISEALSHRPDIMAAQESITQSHYNQNLADAKAIPDLDIGVEADRQAPSTTTFLGVGFSIPLPIFDTNKAEREKARLSYLQSKTAYERNKAAVIMQVNQAFDDFTYKQNLFSLYTKKVTDAQRILETTQQMFALRGVDILALIDAENNFKEYRLNMISARIDAATAKTTLDLTMGRLPCEIKQ